MPLSVRLPGDLESRLQSLADRTGRSKTYYVIEAIREYIEVMEDIYLAEGEIEAMRAGRSESLPLEEVMKHYGMAG